MHSILQFTRRPDVTLYATGRIDITSRVAKTIGIKDGDVIDIAESNGEYWIYIRQHAESVVGAHEATVRSSKKGSRNLRCYSKRLCQYMLAVHGICGKGASLRVPAGRTIQHQQYGTMMALVTRLNIIKNPPND